jgi:hypothetical protein
MHIATRINDIIALARQEALATAPVSNPNPRQAAGPPAERGSEAQSRIVNSTCKLTGGEPSSPR